MLGRLFWLGTMRVPCVVVACCQAYLEARKVGVAKRGELMSAGREARAGAGRLVVMRHGESLWTDKAHNRFAGWVDIPLTDRGRVQAHHAGILLREAGIAPELCMTSVLWRSIETARIVLDELGCPWLPVERSWRLNERHYGAFQGQTRPAMRERYGDELFARYRRSYDVRPPELDVSSQYFQGSDPRYGVAFADGLDSREPARIVAESLQDLSARLEPLWRARMAPRIAAGTTALVVAHGSTVRALRMMLEGIAPADIATVNVPTGVPLLYEFERTAAGEVQACGAGRYLDEAAAQAGIRAVQELGR